MLFGRRELSRTELLEKAGTAVKKKNWKKAVSLYEDALSKSPGDFEIHAKLAPVLVKTGDESKAWQSFTKSYRGFKDSGFHDRAIAVLKSAAINLPKELKCWENLANAYIERGKNHEAVDAYLLGRKNFKDKDEVKTAIKLLYKAFDLRQWNYDITFDLAKAYQTDNDNRRALELYLGLEKRSKGKQLRAVRWKLIGADDFSFTRLWLWMRAAFTGR